MLALHNYHDVRGSFPASAVRMIFKSDTAASGFYEYNAPNAANGPRACFGGLIQLFPFIEQVAAYDDIYATVHDSAVGNLDSWSTGRLGSGTPRPLQGTNAAFACPSDNTVEVSATTSTKISYMMCRGDITERGTPVTSAAGVVAANPAINKRGLFPRYEWHSMGSVTDGTSNTVGFSEALAGGVSNKVKSGAGVVSATNLRTNPQGNCSVSATGLLTSDKLTYTNPHNSTSNPQRGSNILDARIYTGTFTTVNPPNTPACTSQAAGNNSFATTIHHDVLPPTSNHPGGVQIGLLDGSVRFISDTINALSSGVSFGSAVEKASGNSDFGVWGALGSVDGGESAAL